MLGVIAGLALVGVLPASGCRAAGGPAERPSALGRPGRATPRPLPDPVRAIWVARFHYRRPDDVRAIIRNCAAIGCNTVFWQVRGEGTVAYPSRIEPWSREFGFRSPGFDPLALAIQEAHRHGLRIEAWINVLPGWRGKIPPPIADHIYHAHPEWFLYDALGHRQPLNDSYVIVNPCLPEVRQYIVSLVEEVVARYDVDGVHLDYVRYAWDGDPSAKRRYPCDRRTLALYQREVGKRPADDAQAWDHWRANQLTRLVGQIRATVDRYRPGASLTAAVWRNPYRGYEEFLQNSIAWLRTGLVDAVVPMAYTEAPEQLESDVEAYRQLAGRRRVIPGLGIYLHKSPEQLRAQLQRCRQWGGSWALFSYESLFPTSSDQDMPFEARAQQEGRRQMRRAVLAELTPPRR